MNNEKGDVMSKVLALKILGGFAATGAISAIGAVMVNPAFGMLVAVGVCGGLLAGGNAP